jgi:hypothetical protein
MKLTLWIAEQNEDSPAYNIVARTRTDALAQIKERPHTAWDAPRKVVITYKDAFDLFAWVTGENGGRHAYY